VCGEREALAKCQTHAGDGSEQYTSTMLYIWLRRVRLQQRIITLAPVVLTGLAGFSFAKEWLPAWALAVLALLATLIPSVAEKLEIETHADELKRSAAEYKSLQDRFRVLAKIIAKGGVQAAQQEAKIKAGHYDFSVDISLREAAGNAVVDPVQPSR